VAQITKDAESGYFAVIFPLPRLQQQQQQQ